MKKIVILLIMFTMLFSACKKKETHPSKIYITATVTDKETSLPIDSVKVTLYKSNFGSVWLANYYTNNLGSVNLSFHPEESSFGSYYLRFYKEGYLSTGEECSCETPINLDKDNQDFKIQLTKK